MKVYTCNCCFQGIYPGQEFRRSGKKKFHLKPDCASAKSQSEPAPFVWERMFEGGVRFIPTYLPRTISTSVQRTTVDRQCWCCESGDYDQSWIYPGQQYQRRVRMFQLGECWENKKCFHVYYSHYPECPIKEDDPESGNCQARLLSMKKKSTTARRQLRRAA